MTPSSSAFGGQANNDPTRQDRVISGGFAGERGGNLLSLLDLSELSEGEQA